MGYTPVNKPLNILHLSRDLQRRYVNGYAYEEQVALKLKNCYVMPNGIVISNLKFVKGCFYSPDTYKKKYYKTALKHYLLSFITRWGRGNKTKYNNSVNYSIIHQPYINYYHWLIESLLRLMVLQNQNEPYTLIIPGNLHKVSYIKEYLSLLGVKYEVLEGERSIYAKNMLLPTMVWWGARYNPSLILQLRNKILTAFDKKHSNNSVCNTRVFVVRGKGRRKIINLEEVCQMVVSYGFTAIDFEGLTVEEQIAVTRNAEFVIGQHGAGLSNIMFMPLGGTVVEIVSDPADNNNTFDDAYCILSSCLSHSYYVFTAEMANKATDFYNADYIVNVAGLEKTIQQALENKDPQA